jgi:ABC-2 type transport system ATP-binding protein
MTLADPAIQVRGLIKDYRKVRAVNGLDFEIPRGVVAGFLGPNGAGKTTTFRAILGLTRITDGEISILGRPIPGRLQEVTKLIGAIIEEPGLIKALSGRINLEVAADTLGMGHDRIDPLLDFVGLTADAKRKVGEYSKGMRQRLALAAALLNEPELLILDEPLDGLDPAGQRAFRGRLRSIADEGRTVVVSSHDLADIEALADYVVVVNHGRLVTQGSLDSLLSGGATRVVVGDQAEAALGVLAESQIAGSASDGWLTVDESDGSKIIRLLAAHQIYPSEVTPARSTLESVFLGMTGEDEA